MKLASLNVQNYRCFESLDLQLEEDLMVFVGGNGAGKTTLLTAMCALLAPILGRLPLMKRIRNRSVSTPDIRLITTDVQAPFSQLTASGTLPGVDSLQWDLMRLRDHSPATKAQAPKERSELKQLYAAVDRIVDAHNQSVPYVLPVFAYYGTSRAVDVPHYRMQKGAIPRSFRRLMGLENALESKANFRLAVSWFDLLEQRELREQRDSQPSEATHSLLAVRRAIESMIPGLSNPRIDSRSGRLAVDVVDPSGVPIKLHLDQLSDGYQVMLGVVMDLALRLSLANPPESPEVDVLQSEAIVLIDEVDLHLHPVWQQRVIPDLRRTFPNTQLILTTHSPQVATTVPSRSLRILKDGKLYGAPAGAEGSEAERMLEDVFGAKARPDLPMVRNLSRYLQLVDNREWDSPEAANLRKQLDEWSQGEEPLLTEADLRIENFKWETAE